MQQQRQYVGINLRRSVIVRVGESGQHLSTVRIDNDTMALAAEVAKAGEHPEVVLEATYGWYWAVESCGLSATVHLAHPSGLNWGQRRRKDDEIDAVDLVDMLRLGRLPEASVRAARHPRAAGDGSLPGQAGVPALGPEAQVRLVLAKEGVRMGIENRLDLAVAALVFAAFLDGIDGRVARLLKASSRFGAELDSLADFVNFGVAPAIIMFNWALEDLHSLGWIAVLVFAVCSALRLARFNVSLDRTDPPAWKSNYFVGVPAPAGAIVLLLPIYAAGSRAASAEPDAARAVLYARHRAAHGQQRADFLWQDDRPKDPTRIRAAVVRAGRAFHRLAFDLSLGHPCDRIVDLSRHDPGQRLSLSHSGAKARRSRGRRTGRGPTMAIPPEKESIADTIPNSRSDPRAEA